LCRFFLRLTFRCAICSIRTLFTCFSTPCLAAFTAILKKKWHRPDPNHLSIAVNAARQGVEKQVKSVRIEQIAHLNVNRRKNRHKNRQRIRLHEKSQSTSSNTMTGTMKGTSTPISTRQKTDSKK
jgi:hypothetical protein